MKALIYIGVILGAGFASGAEIMAYFVDFGRGGFYGLILAASIFAFTGYAIWDICAREDVSDYKSFMDAVMGRRFAKVMEAVLGIFMFIIFAAMLAAMGSALNESFGMNYTMSIIIVAAICFFTFLFGMGGIIKLNAYISPVLIGGCILIAVWTFVMRDRAVFFTPAEATELMRGQWYISAVTYVGYNIIGAVVILPSLVSGRGEKVLKPAILAGVMLFILGFSIYISLLANIALVTDVQIPLLALAIRQGTIFTYLFMLIFLAACFSTAATNGYAVCATITGRYRVSGLLLKILICTLGVVAAMAGFSNFVRVIYPIFAAAGVVEIFFVIKAWLRSKSLIAEGRKM